jgi:hypothetical protein
MEALKLFDSKERSDLDPSFYNENPFDYYDRSARKESGNIRLKLNSWFSTYPVSERKELKERFKKTFSSAFFELFIYQLFIQQGFEIVVHPELPNSTKRPDFLLTKDSNQFYLEAKESRDKTKAEESVERKLNQFYDQLDKIKSPNFVVTIADVIFKTNEQPGTKKAIKAIESEIEKYDPDEVEKTLLKSGYDAFPHITYEDNVVKVIISLLPKVASQRNLISRRAIGALPIESLSSDTNNSIKDAVMKKAKRYGVLDKPYFICVNALGIPGSESFSAENALWGSLVYTWSTNPIDKNERLERLPDGLFFDKAGPKNRNLSGVLITKVNEYNIHNASHWFAKHPFANKDFDFSIFDLTHLFVNEKMQVEKVTKKSIGDVLVISPSWLTD